MEGVGIALVVILTILRADGVLVRIVLFYTRNEQMPDALLVALHHVCIPAPAIELAHDGDLNGIGRKHGEVIPLLSVHCHWVCTHKFIGAAVTAGIKQGVMFFLCHRPCLQCHAFISL